MEKTAHDQNTRLHPGVNILLITIYAGLALLVLWLWHTHRLEGLHIWMEQAGPFAYLAYVLIYVLFSISFLPVMWLNLTAITFFGPLAGGAIILLSVMAASTATFYLSRNLIKRSWIQTKLSHPMLNKLTCDTHSWKTVLLLRLSNAVPFCMINYLPGVMDIRYRNFMAATLLGSIPGTLALAGLGTFLFKLFGH